MQVAQCLNGLTVSFRSHTPAPAAKANSFLALMRLTVTVRGSEKEHGTRSGGCSARLQSPPRLLAPPPCSPLPSGLPFLYSLVRYVCHGIKLSGNIISMAEIRCALHFHCGAPSNRCQQCPYGTRQSRRVSMQAGWESCRSYITLPHPTQ